MQASRLSQRDQRTSIVSLIHQNGDASSQQIEARAPDDLFTYWDRSFYQVDRRVMYTSAVDEHEQARLDILHRVIYDFALGGRFYTADLRPTSRRRKVLDVGCGTGIWCFELANDPKFEVVGIDLCSEMLPDEPYKDKARIITPVNFLQREWPFRPDEFDLIHNAQLTACVPDWLEHFRKCFRHLKRGGAVEHVDIDWQIQCTPGQTPPPEYAPVLRWWELMCQASQETNKPFRYPNNIRQLLLAAGFVNPAQRSIQIPISSRPQAHWSEMENFFKIGMFQTFDNLPRDLLGMSLYPLTRLGWSESAIRRLCSDVANACWRPSSSMFFEIHVFTAYKP